MVKGERAQRRKPISDIPPTLSHRLAMYHVHPSYPSKNSQTAPGTS